MHSSSLRSSPAWEERVNVCVVADYLCGEGKGGEGMCVCVFCGCRLKWVAEAGWDRGRVEFAEA